VQQLIVLRHVRHIGRRTHQAMHQAGFGVEGPNRHLAFSTVHMIDMARALVDRSLESAQNG
jgi:hypothetical protein